MFLFGSLISLLFLVVIALVAKVTLTVSVSSLILNTIVATIHTLGGTEKVIDMIDKVECNSMVGYSMQMLTSEAPRISVVKSMVSSKLPSIASFDARSGNLNLLMMSSATNSYTITFVDLNSFSDGQSVSFEGPVILYQSAASKVSSKLKISVKSKSMIAFCQSDLLQTRRNIQVSAPVLALDVENDEKAKQKDFDWGTIQDLDSVTIYTFKQIKDVMKGIILNKTVKSFEDVKPVVAPVATIPVAKSHSVFKAQTSKACSWNLNCEITMNQKQVQETATSYFDSKGGAITTTFSKKIPVYGSFIADAHFFNPRISFVKSKEGKEKIRIIADVTLVTSNIQLEQFLKSQVITATIESSVRYNDNDWTIYVKDAQAIDIEFSHPNPVAVSLRQPLIVAFNTVGKEKIEKMPVYDLHRLGLKGAGAGYLLNDDGIRILNKQLVIRLSVL